MLNSNRLFGSTRGVTVAIILAMLMAAGIVFTAQLFFKDFFFIDDAQIAFLPFFKEIGRIILSGHWPILTTHTFLGGNLLVDMVFSPFSPQSVVTGLLATQVESFRFAANFLAWLNITLVIAGAYWLGRTLTIRPSYAMLLGFLAATNPVFLFVFSASWWNFASAFAWFTVSMAAFMQFRLTPTAGYFVTAVVSSCFLFASAGTHMQIAYLVGFGVVLCIDYVEHKKFQRMFTSLLIGVCAVSIAAIPIMAEYAVNASLVERLSDFNNVGNFLVPSWGSIVNAFNPFYGAYIHWFGGYRFISLSLGYVGIIAVIIFFTDKKPTEYPKNYKIIGVLILLLLVLVFSSSQFGPTRYPFRFLPAWALMVTALMVYHIEKSIFILSSKKLYYFIGFIAFATLIQLFSADNAVFTLKNIIFCVVFILLSAGLVVCFFKLNGRQKNNISVLGCVSVLAWVGMLAQNHSLGKVYLAHHKHLTEQVTGLDGQDGHYALVLSPDHVHPHIDFSDLGSAMFLLYGQQTIKTINGYSPVFHRGVRQLLPFPTPHSLFSQDATLRSICQPSGLKSDVFLYQLLDIGRIFAWQNHITPEIAVLLAQAGLKITPYPVPGKVLITPINPHPVEGSLTYQSAPGTVRHDTEDGMMHEWFNVDKVDTERTLVFSRVYWRGYHAVIDGQEYAVSAYKDALVKVTLPAGVQGRLHLYYEPVSWQYTKWSLLFGVILAGGIAAHLARQKKTRK